MPNYTAFVYCVSKFFGVFKGLRMQLDCLQIPRKYSLPSLRRFADTVADAKNPQKILRALRFIFLRLPSSL
jgi:hypothetical protein